MRIENDLLGDAGEDAFASICSSSGMIVSRTSRDKFGWDFILQTDLDCDGQLPADSTGLPFECKVQVKATNNQERNWQINLKNLKRMCFVPTPSFICVLEFKNEREPQEVFLIHIDEAIIVSVLKRLRTLDNQVEASELHRHTLTIRYNEEHRLERPAYQNIKSALLNAAPDGMGAYAKWKSAIIESAGFEQGVGEVKLTIRGDTNVLEEMHNLVLGQQESIEFRDFEYKDKRFNIISSRPRLEADSGRMKVVPSQESINATLHFTSKRRLVPLQIKAQVFPSPLNSLMGNNQKKYRIESVYFEMLISEIMATINLSINLFPTKKGKLSDLSKLCQLVEMLSENEEGIDFSVLVDDKFAFGGQIQIEQSESLDDLSRLSTIVAQATEICTMSTLRDDEIKVNVKDLLRFSENLKQFHVLTTSEMSCFKIEMHLPDVDKTISELNGVAAVLPAKTKLGDLVVVVPLAFIGSFRRTQGVLFEMVPNRRECGPVLVKHEMENLQEAIVEKSMEDFETYLDKLELDTVRIE